MPPWGSFTNKFLTQLIEGSKKFFLITKVSMAKTFTMPEFDKKVLWKFAAEDPEFLEYIPDNMIDKHKRIPKEWFWRTMVAHNPTWAEKYTEKVLELIQERKKKKKKENQITISEEHKKLFDKLNIKPSQLLLLKPKNRAVSKTKRKRPAAKDFGLKFGSGQEEKKGDDQIPEQANPGDKKEDENQNQAKEPAPKAETTKAADQMKLLSG